ncbi:hypothetical protein [Paenibacillus cymbidii]|uniref:hypothetical protein n=1 Tax=Paenibacillus cymbidii TaxID=1639034 RepID=UPI0010822695|nr:hypothetical protein [Paenibacillus cymbidii]
MEPIQSQPQSHDSQPASRPADPFLEERIRSYPSAPMQAHAPAAGVPPYAPRMRKSKFVTGLLSLFMPGTGHFYLGLMPKGLFMMMLFFVNIAAIPYFAINAEGDNTMPIIVLISLLLPVIYFYSLFDALQSADAINASLWQAQQTGQPWQMPVQPINGNHFGLFLIGFGLVVFLFTTKPVWVIGLFTHGGAYVGAILLIAAGVVMFWLDRRK